MKSLMNNHNDYPLESLTFCGLVFMAVFATVFAKPCVSFYTEYIVA